MAAITTTGSIPASSGIARAEAVRTAFSEHNQELAWLAEFLTGDQAMASVCVTDAGTLKEDEKGIFQEWLKSWPREATIRSALDVQRMRIAQLASAYERQDSVDTDRVALPVDTLKLVVEESHFIGLKLDTICRFVLVLCGFEDRSSLEVAVLLGVSEHAVQAAYSTALQFLDIMRSEEMAESYGSAAAWN